MLLKSPPGRHNVERRNTFRAISFICVALVFLFILFDVLDVDGSSFPRAHSPAPSCLVSAESPSDAAAIHRLDRSELWEDTALLADRLEECARLQTPEIVGSSPLNYARSRGYRTGLPRDPLPDA